MFNTTQVKQRGRMVVRLGLLWTLAVIVCAIGSPLFAADQQASESGSPQAASGHGELGELARNLNNPVSSVWNIVTQNNWYFMKGAPSGVYRGEYVMNFQPVLPIPLTREWSLVFRPVVPLESMPYVRGVDWHTGAIDWTRTAGLGDITLDPILVPALKPWLIFGFGPTVVLPTANTTTLGSGKLQLGPAVVLGFLTHKYVGGVFIQNWWSVAGGHSTPVVNQMNLQYFLYRMLPNAW